MKKQREFLIGFERHLKHLLLANDALGECYLQSAYSACAFKALGMNPRLLAGRFGIAGTGVSVPHAWVLVDGYLFDASGKLNIDLMWDIGDVPEYSPFKHCDSDPDLIGSGLIGKSVNDYIKAAPSPINAFNSLGAFLGMLDIRTKNVGRIKLMQSVQWEMAK